MPASEAPRRQLADALRPLLPATWRIREHDAPMDKLSTTTVILSQREMRPLPASPSGALEIEFLVTVVSDRERSQDAEDALDDDVLAVVAAMRANRIVWSTAKKVLYGSANYLAYDIDGVTVTGSPDPQPKE